MAEINNNKETSYSRSTAFKTDIKSLKQGNFISKEGLEPSYTDTIYGKISRANLIGVIISKTDNSFEIEDGTSRINVREGITNYPNINFRDFQIGHVVNVIGKTRFFNQEIYIVPEIVKSIENQLWVKVRKQELGKRETIKEKNELEKPISNENIDETSVQIIDNEQKNKQSLSTEAFISQLKKLDKGNGVEIEFLLEKIKISDGKNMISKLLEQGEVFEIRPGIIKVLE
jgi:RPA family protein